MNWTAEADKTILDGMEAGASARMIADRLGTTRNAVMGRRFRMGLCEKGSRGRPYTDHEKATFRAMCAAGKHYDEIARALKRTTPAIATQASLWGISRMVRT